MPSPTATTSTRRRPTSERLSQRKRAPIACQFCRIRKTRCDGVKPVCGFCQHHDAQCVWGAALDETESTPAEKEILRRLDELKELLAGSEQAASPAIDVPHSLSVPNAQDYAPSPLTATSHTSTLGPSIDEASPFFNIRTENVLRWPLFHSVLDVRDLTVESFVLESGGIDEGANGPRQTRPGSTIGIQESLLVPLCQKFLAQVHPRNPILDEAQLIHFAKHATEHGLDWDGPSCLVLIACALASYTEPWDQNEQQHARVEHLKHENVEVAEMFYLAAKKRSGLLGWSLVDIQCLFFFSVYEKYVLNPVQAWFCIQQASCRLQAQLKQRTMQTQSQGIINDIPKQNDLTQRAFWSIYKAEHELLPELPFHSSGLEVFTRADSMFPSPPAFDPTISAGSSSDQQNFSLEERSWAFYLAEISIRRTISDTIATLYRKGEQYWLTHVQTLVRQCEECQSQIQLWYSHLPASIWFDIHGYPDNELSTFMQGRFFHWREHVLRPLLYYVLHRKNDQTLTEQILACAHEHVSLCAEIIIRSHNTHRHGGIWFICRGTFLHALLILGVVLRAEPRLPPPSNWATLVATSISTLQRWESQAADIKRVRVILEQLFTNVCGVIGVSPFLPDLIQ